MSFKQEVFAGTLAGVLSGVVMAFSIWGVTFWKRDAIHDWLVSQDPPARSQANWNLLVALT